MRRRKTSEKSCISKKQDRAGMYGSGLVGTFRSNNVVY
jgi:hypothetical protein